MKMSNKQKCSVLLPTVTQAYRDTMVSRYYFTFGSYKTVINFNCNVKTMFSSKNPKDQPLHYSYIQWNLRD